MTAKEMDQRALEIANTYKQCEKELLDIIGQIDRTKAFRKLGYSSLFQYVVNRLGLSEAVSYNFISVAQKAHEVPELKEAIDEGALSVTKVKKMTSVITQENKDTWIGLAKEESTRKLEREVSLATGKSERPGSMKYVSMNEEVKERVSFSKSQPRVQLKVSLSEEMMIKLRRVQDLISQKKKTSVDLEATLEEMTNDYLHRLDPVEKAKRSQIRRGAKKSKEDKAHVKKQKEENKENPDTSTLAQTNSPKRTQVPASVKHQVFHRDQGQCRFHDKQGNRCFSKRFIEIHHKIPISQGGGHELENLVLLCSGHHKLIHERERVT